MKKKSFLSTYKFTGIFAMAVALVLYLISSFGETDPLEVTKHIEINLQHEIDLQSEYMGLVSQDFSHLLSSETPEINYPTFVFTKSKLVHWNTSRIDLKFDKLARLDTLGLISIPQGQYLYQRKIVDSGKERYILVSLIPLVSKYGLTNKYLTTTFNDRVFKRQIELVKENTDGSFPINFEDIPLFFIKVSKKTPFPESTVYILNALSFAFIVFLIISIYLLSIEFLKIEKGLKGFVILLIGNLIMRVSLIAVSFPFVLTNIDLFNSSIYVSSLISPSLGDLLLNVVSLLTIVLYLFESRIYIAENINNLMSKRGRVIVNVLLYFLGFWVLFFYAAIILDILANSQIDLDISKSIEFNSIRSAAMIVIILSGLISFLLVHVIYKIVFDERHGFVQGFLSIALPCTLVMGAIGLTMNDNLLPVLVVHFIYFFVIYLNDLPSRMRKFRFGSLLYILTAILLFSVVGAISVYTGYERNDLIQKQKFATKLLIDRDIEGEFLLGQITKKIKSDMIMNSKLISPKISVSQIRDRVGQLFIDGYFSGYNIRTSIFDKDGIGLGGNAGLIYYADVRNKFNSQEFRTDFENIFFEGNFLATGRKRYVCFIELQRYENRTGYVVLELHQKKQVSKSVYPELLLDNRHIGNNAFDYAVFDNNGLAHSSGAFNYKADFATVWLTSPDIFEEGIEKYGFHHLAVQADRKIIIISSKLYAFWAILSNFSFFFLLFLGVAVFLITINTLFNHETVSSVNFSTKILIYLGCAFAVPLLLVGTAILDTLNKSYKAEIDKSYQKQTVAMGEGFVDLIIDFYNNEMNRDGVSNELLKISRSSRADINLYDNEGKLISTSQPKILEANLLSPYINPVALDRLKNQNKDKVILEESLGKLTYKSSFVAIRSYDDGKLLGIMSSPFFSSKNHLSRQQTEVFNNIINISTIIFIVSIGLSYVAVRRLTNPIMLIASKLKKTGLSEDNPPLEWTSNDEIGVLVREYNSMLEKLEFSKKELARNEKEAAWREMAKQVAHEIKNPLTPMKLTLQHLDRVMDEDNESRKSLSTLLSQVDTLDQIVTSFSHFAKMPDPENEIFDILQELDKIVNLHPDKNIKFEFGETEALINADRKLFGRIFNNLILNAFQSMNSVRKPELNISIENEGDKVTLIFSDVGTGISDDIKEKVFIPNFSTKDSGSGIGLAVAKRGIEHAGGHIWFEPNVPKGTVFYIELPMV